MTNSQRSSRGILLLSYWSGWCILYQNSFNSFFFMFKISSFSFIVQRRYLNLRLTCFSNQWRLDICDNDKFLPFSYSCFVRSLRMIEAQHQLSLVSALDYFHLSHQIYKVFLDIGYLKWYPTKFISLI